MSLRNGQNYTITLSQDYVIHICAYEFSIVGECTLERKWKKCKDTSSDIKWIAEGGGQQNLRR